MRRVNVCFWHKADMAITLSDVCFWGVKRTWRLTARMSANDPKRTWNLNTVSGRSALI